MMRRPKGPSLIMPRLAVTHLPSPNLSSGIRTYVSEEQIDFALALRQHAAYGEALASCGVEVRTLSVNQELPDSVFLEDTAVVLDEVAIICVPGAAARQAEPAGIAAALREYRELKHLERGTLEGGDVLRVGRTLLVGQSSRTNAEGIGSLAETVRRYGYEVISVPVTRCLHLKTACTALPDGRLLVNADWIDVSALRGYPLLSVPGDDPWGANTLPIGEHVIVPAARAATQALIERAGFQTLPVDVSEFAKAEGSVTCMNLLFDAEYSSRSA
jgi:dimethylargininase